MPSFSLKYQHFLLSGAHQHIITDLALGMVRQPNSCGLIYGTENRELR